MCCIVTRYNKHVVNLWHQSFQTHIITPRAVDGSVTGLMKLAQGWPNKAIKPCYKGSRVHPFCLSRWTYIEDSCFVGLFRDGRTSNTTFNTFNFEWSWRWGWGRHPWPYLESMFSLVGVNENSYRMKCLLCLPKDCELMAFKNSLLNLKKHIYITIRQNIIIHKWHISYQ